MKINNILNSAFLKAGLLVLAIFVLCFFYMTSMASASTIGTWYKDPFGIRDFVNSKGYSIASAYNGAGAMNFDNSTAQKICQLAGYDSVASMDCVSIYDGGRCGWYSCHDNVLANWNASTNNFDIINACTAGNKWISSLVCKNIAPVCTSQASKQCVGNSIYWYNSCGTKEDLFLQCTANQTCSNGSCVNLSIACNNNSACGTNVYTGSPFCQNGDVYQNYKTYTCNNPGTANSSCTNSTDARLKTNCTANQTCSNGSCNATPNIACSTNANCGTNSLTGNPFCQGNNVFTNQLTYYCNNPGTPQSFCSNSFIPQLTKACGTNKTCNNGDCVTQNIACGSNSDCGTNGLTGNAFCQDDKVYKNYITYSCNNSGTSQSFCSSSLTPQLALTCSPTQNCVNGSCTGHAQTVTCNTNSQCGTNVYTGSPFCQNGDVYQNYKTYTCNNPGTANSSCTNSTVSQLKNTCTGSQDCSNGSCGNTCTHNSAQQCVGNNLYWFDSCGVQQDLIQYCPNGCTNGYCSQNNNISVQTNSATNISNSQATLNGYLSGYNNYNTVYVWFQWGTSTSYGYETSRQTMSYTGSFNQNVANINNYATYHFRAVAQSSNGNIFYGQNMTFTAENQTGNLLTISKTVRNLSSGVSGWANTAYAVPSDMLMFMITVQATGNQSINNVFVRDILPSTLIYKNQLVVSGSNNYNNYSGDVTSGINLNTILAGQTVTITYQAQVAAAQNFSYGTSTINNSATVTSSGYGYNPTSNASVVVTRATVLGATSISTGLTNNFLADSFFLPLIIALLGLWMFKSGIFSGIEGWINNRKIISNGQRSTKELNSRIDEIKRAENF
jgi:uncharacterized repeat protein (TIGR01451 family)